MVGRTVLILARMYSPPLDRTQNANPSLSLVSGVIAATDSSFVEGGSSVANWLHDLWPIGNR